MIMIFCPGKPATPRRPPPGRSFLILRFLALFAAFSGPLSLTAATIIVSTSANWSALAGGTGTGGLPGSGDAVLVEGNATLTVDGSSDVCGTLTLGSTTGSPGTGTIAFGSGDQLTVTTLNVGASITDKGSINMTAGGTLVIGGVVTLTDLGTFTAGTGAVDYNGNTTQTIPGGLSTYNNLTIANPSGVILGAATAVGGALNINSGASLNTSSANNYALTLDGNFVNNGTFAANGSAIIIAGTATAQSIAGFTTTGTVSLTKTAGTATLAGNVNGGGLTINGSGGTLDLGASLTHTFTGTWTRTAGTLNGDFSVLNLGGALSGTGSTFTAATGTVNYNAAGAQTVAQVTYNNLTLSGSGAKTITTATTTVNGILTMAGTATASAAPTYGSLATLAYNGSAAQITGLEFPSTWNGSGGIHIANPSGVTLNQAKTINASLIISSGASFNSSAANNYAVTFGGSVIDPGPGFAPNNSTITYAGAAQTIDPVTYNNLTLSGSGTAILSGVAVNGIFNLGGTVVVSAAPAYGPAATLEYSGTTAQTIGPEFVTPWTASGGVLMASPANVTLTRPVTINAPFTINSGAACNTSVAGNYGVTLGGNFVTSGTFAANASPITISGTGTQSIAGFTTTGTVFLTKTSGTATLTGAANGGALIINGTGGNLDLGTGLTHSFTSSLTLTAGILLGDASTLNLGGSATASGGTFSAGTGTVNYIGIAPVVAPLTYNNLTLSGSGTATTTGATVNGLFVLAGTATVSAAPAYGSTATLEYNGSAAQTTGPEWLASWTASGGVIIANPAGVTLGGAVTIDAPFVINTGAAFNTSAANNYAVTFGSSVIDNGTFTPNSSTITYAAAGAQTVAAAIYYNLVLAGSGVKTITTLTTTNLGTLTLAGTAAASAMPAYGPAATLVYNGSGLQTNGPEFLSPWNGSGGVIIANTAGSVTLTAAKVINAPLTINSGATLKSNKKTITFGGNFLNNGTFTTGNSAIIISGTGTQNIAGFTTTGKLSLTKTAGTATFTGNVIGGGLLLDGPGGTLDLGTGLSHDFTGTFTRTAGTLNVDTSTLALAGVVATTGSGVLIASNGTVNYARTTAQTVVPVTYGNLILSGAKAKTINAGTVVTGNFSIDPTGSATATIPTGQNIPVGSLTLGGVNQVAGTWGSTAATVATHHNNTYFTSTATGYVTVATNPQFEYATGTFGWDNNVTPAWSLNSGGPYNDPWTNGNSAALEGSLGTVSLASSLVAANSLTFNTSGFVIQNNTLTLVTPGDVFAGPGISASISSILAGAIGLDLAGGGSLTITAASTESGTLAIGADSTLVLAGAGSISHTPKLSLDNNSTLDVSALAAGFTFTGSGPQQTLADNDNSGGTATINAPSHTVALNTGALLSFQAEGDVDGVNVSSIGNLSVTGNLALNNNSVAINVSDNNLAVGTYPLIACTGALTGSVNLTPSFTGQPLAGGYVATLQNTTGTGGGVDLTVTATPSFSSLTSPGIAYGTTSLILTGNVGNTIGNGNVYPALGDPVTATINGQTVTGVVTDTSGDFTVNYNDPSLATDGIGGSPYTITFGYAGNSSQYLTAAANDTSTTLTVTTATPTVTVNVGTYTYNGLSQGPDSVTTSTTDLGAVSYSYAGAGGTTYGPGTSPPTASGSYTVTASVAADANNTSAVSSPTPFVIGEAALTVTANNVKKTYGTALASPGAGSTAFTTSGLQNGETIGSVTIAYGTGSAAHDSAGVHPGTVTAAAAVGGTFNASNYSLVYNAGNLIVNQLAVTLAGAEVYRGTVVVPNSALVVANALSGDTVTLVSGSGTLAGSGVGSQAISAVGSLVLGGSSAANYTLVGASGTVTITVKALTALSTLALTSKVYDGTTTANPTGAAALQPAEPAGSGTSADGRPYSVDAVSLTGLAAYNYNTKDVATAATVTGSGLSLTGTGNSNYTLTAPALSATITPASPAVLLDSSENPSGFKDSVTFTASIVTNGVTAGDATGTVQFQTNAVAFGLAVGLTAGSVGTNLATLPRQSNPLVASYSGDANYLGAISATLAQIVTNHPPVAAVYNVSRTAGLNLVILWSDVTNQWSDVDGDPVTLSGISVTTTNGVTLLTNNVLIVYRSSTSVNDQITYGISDGHGGTNQGFINLAVTPFVTGQTTGAVSVSGRSVTTKFFGIPGYVYEVQRATNLVTGVNWVNISTNTIGAGGQFMITDDFSDLGGIVPSSAYYRLEWHP